MYRSNKGSGGCPGMDEGASVSSGVAAKLPVGAVTPCRFQRLPCRDVRERSTARKNFTRWEPCQEMPTREGGGGAEGVQRGHRQPPCTPPIPPTHTEGHIHRVLHWFLADSNNWSIPQSGITTQCDIYAHTWRPALASLKPTPAPPSHMNDNGSRNVNEAAITRPRSSSEPWKDVDRPDEYACRFVN